VDSVAIQWWQLSHPFYEAYLPLAAAIQCAFLHPWLLTFPLVQLALFAQTFLRQLPELQEALRIALAWLSGGWRLDVDASERAWVRPYFAPRPGARVAIDVPGPERWSIRLARPGLVLRSGRQYRIRFRVRAANARSIMFGVWQDHAPWDGIGLCEELSVSERWQKIDRQFHAALDEKHGYFGFWLGGEPGSVDLSGCSIRPIRHWRTGKI
jgi:hypothetical protein